MPAILANVGESGEYCQNAFQMLASLAITCLTACRVLRSAKISGKGHFANASTHQKLGFFSEYTHLENSGVSGHYLCIRDVILTE